MIFWQCFQFSFVYLWSLITHRAKGTWLSREAWVTLNKQTNKHTQLKTFTDAHLKRLIVYGAHKILKCSPFLLLDPFCHESSDISETQDETKVFGTDPPSTEGIHPKVVAISLWTKVLDYQTDQLVSMPLPMCHLMRPNMANRSL